MLGRKILPTSECTFSEMYAIPLLSTALYAIILLASDQSKSECSKENEIFFFFSTCAGSKQFRKTENL